MKKIILICILFCCLISNAAYLDWKLSDSFYNTECINVSATEVYQRYMVSLYQIDSANNYYDTEHVQIYAGETSSNLHRTRISPNRILEFKIYDIITYDYKTDLPLFQHKNEYYIGSIYIESNWLIENDYTRDIFNYYDYGQSAPKTYILGSVPEPTSGLLMLLGIGLFGLRRKIVK